ncbi:hypothetical protein F5X97DRAFT_339027 [Nemania serpens]|nr:hypothetical protein F5X97DRAFT_339027 [Nemania serpens]
MSAYTISERFTCGHIQTTSDLSHAPLNSESLKEPSFLSNSNPLPTRCLACICTSILSIPNPRLVPRSSIRDLLAHVQILHQRASPVMRCELQGLADHVRRVDDGDVVEFQRAVLALAGYLEVCAWFGV